MGWSPEDIREMQAIHASLEHRIAQYEESVKRHVEEAADRVFLRLFGDTLRPKPTSDPTRNGNAKGQLVPDFRKLLDDD